MIIRFRIRAILIVTALVAVLLGYVTHQRRVLVAERELIATMFEVETGSYPGSSHRSRLAYDDRDAIFGMPPLEFAEYATLTLGNGTSNTPWLARLLIGEDAYNRIVEIELDDLWADEQGTVVAVRSILPALKGARHLEVLFIESNISDEDLATIPVLPNLCYLCIEGIVPRPDPRIPFTGLGIQHLKAQRNLAVLDLRSKAILGKYVGLCGDLQSLRVLALESGDWENAKLSQLAGLNQLEYLQLGTGRIVTDHLQPADTHLNDSGHGSHSEADSDNETDYILPPLSNLRVLRMIYTGLGDRLDASIANQTSLKELDISGSESLQPETVSVLKDGGLRSLVAQSCTIDQQMFESICHIASLQRLDISGSTYPQECLGQLSKIPDLNQLDLSYSDHEFLESDIVATSLCRNLEVLILAGLPIRDDALGPIIQLRKLRVLDLSKTNITDKALELICTMPSLEKIIVVSTEVTPRGLKALEKCRPNLEVVVTSAF